MTAAILLVQRQIYKIYIVNSNHAFVIIRVTVVFDCCLHRENLKSILK